MQADREKYRGLPLNKKMIITSPSIITTGVHMGPSSYTLA